MRLVSGAFWTLTFTAVFVGIGLLDGAVEVGPRLFLIALAVSALHAFGIGAGAAYLARGVD